MPGRPNLRLEGLPPQFPAKQQSPQQPQPRFLQQNVPPYVSRAKAAVLSGASVGCWPTLGQSADDIDVDIDLSDSEFADTMFTDMDTLEYDDDNNESITSNRQQQQQKVLKKTTDLGQAGEKDMGEGNNGAGAKKLYASGAQEKSKPYAFASDANSDQSYLSVRELVHTNQGLLVKEKKQLISILLDASEHCKSKDETMLRYHELLNSYHNNPTLNFHHHYTHFHPQLTPARSDDILFDFYYTLLSRENLSPPVAATIVLLREVGRSRATTISELSEALSSAAAVLSNHHKYAVAASAGCTFFTRLATLIFSNDPHLVRARSVLLQHGHIFLNAVSRFRERAVHSASQYVGDGAVILVHSFSRAVLRLLKHAAFDGKRLTVYVTECNPSHYGAKVLRCLRNMGPTVHSHMIPDTAVAYIMDRVDMVLVGAEGVAETGGVVNHIGTFQAALVAKARNKPFYVIAESYKFVRMYPLNQYNFCIRPPLSVTATFSPTNSSSSSSPTYLKDYPNRQKKPHDHVKIHENSLNQSDEKLNVGNVEGSKKEKDWHWKCCEYLGCLCPSCRPRQSCDQVEAATDKNKAPRCECQDCGPSCRDVRGAVIPINAPYTKYFGSRQPSENETKLKSSSDPSEGLYVATLTAATTAAQRLAAQVVASVAAEKAAKANEKLQNHVALEEEEVSIEEGPPKKSQRLSMAAEHTKQAADKVSPETTMDCYRMLLAYAKTPAFLDYTPPEYITLLFTDKGALTPSAVSDELIKVFN